MGDGDTRVIVASRGRLAPAALVAAAFSAGSVWLILTSSHPFEKILGWAVLVLFGSGAVVMALQMARPSRLTLDPQGLTSRALFGTSYRRWTDVQRIDLVEYSQYALPPVPAFLSIQIQQIPRAVKLTGRSGVAADLTLKGPWPNVEELVAILDDYLSRFGRPQSGTP